MKRVFITIICLSIISMSQAQQKWQKGGNNSIGGFQTTIGTNNFWNAPFQLMANGQIRMHINQNGTSAVGANTSGFIGVGTTNPYSPLHIVGSQSANAQGWQRGLTLSNSAIVQWDSGLGGGFFMAHPSSSPNGNWYAGINAGPTSSASVNYAFSVFVNDAIGSQNPMGTTNFFKNVLVLQTGFERKLGVNTLDPFRIAEIKSNLSNLPQLRLTTTNNAWAEFQTLTTGNLLLIPQNGRVGVNLGAGTNPTHNLDVNGDARIRNVQTGTPDALIIGTVVGAPEDLALKRVDFTGSAGDVLLGDGTWGTAATSVTASNGCWINGSGDVQWGTNPLLQNTEVPMANRNVLFQTFANSVGSVNIGGSNYSSNSRMYVTNDFDGYQNGLFVNSNTNTILPIKNGVNVYANNSIRLTGLNVLAETGTNVTGIFGNARNGSSFTIGVQGNSSSNTGSGEVFGGKFDASSNTDKQNIGVYGRSSGSPKTNYGGYFVGNGGTFTIGVYGEASNSLGLDYAGYFTGEVLATAFITSPSDENLKTNIAPMGNSMAIINQLAPKTFEYDQASYPQMNLADGLLYGLIAQDVEQILPELVSENAYPEVLDSLGNVVYPEVNFKGLEYEQLIPIMIKGMQEQQAEITSQDSIINDLNVRLTQLENCLSNLLPALCQANAMSVESTSEEMQETLRAVIDIELSDKNNIVLNQNVPNPFAERTVITYMIPETVVQAQIHFYDGTGKLINSVDVTERGNGQINVFASDLSTGIYTYSLVADGKIVSTKRMMKQ